MFNINKNKTTTQESTQLFIGGTLLLKTSQPESKYNSYNGFSKDWKYSYKLAYLKRKPTLTIIIYDIYCYKRFLLLKPWCKLIRSVHIFLPLVHS